MSRTATWQRTKWHVRPAKTQISLGIRPVWSVFAVRMKKALALSYPMSAQWRLIRLGGCLGWSESSLGAHAILLLLSWGGSYKAFNIYILGRQFSRLSGKRQNQQTKSCVSSEDLRTKTTLQRSDWAHAPTDRTLRQERRSFCWFCRGPAQSFRHECLKIVYSLIYFSNDWNLILLMVCNGL